jgi:hypothetical protein
LACVRHTRYTVYRLILLWPHLPGRRRTLQVHPEDPGYNLRPEHIESNYLLHCLTQVRPSCTSLCARAYGCQSRVHAVAPVGRPTALLPLWVDGPGGAVELMWGVPHASFFLYVPVYRWLCRCVAASVRHVTTCAVLPTLSHCIALPCVAGPALPACSCQDPGNAGGAQQSGVRVYQHRAC